MTAASGSDTTYFDAVDCSFRSPFEPILLFRPEYVRRAVVNNQPVVSVSLLDALDGSTAAH